MVSERHCKRKKKERKERKRIRKGRETIHSVLETDIRGKKGRKRIKQGGRGFTEY